MERTVEYEHKFSANLMRSLGEDLRPRCGGAWSSWLAVQLPTERWAHDDLHEFIADYNKPEVTSATLTLSAFEPVEFPASSELPHVEVNLQFSRVSSEPITSVSIRSSERSLIMELFSTYFDNEAGEARQLQQVEKGIEQAASSSAATHSVITSLKHTPSSTRRWEGSSVFVLALLIS